MAVLFTVVGAYYYLKMANAMFMGTAVSEEPVQSTAAMNVALLFAATATIVIGLMPNIFIHAVDWSSPALRPSRNCHAEVTCETQLFTRRISGDHCLSAFFLKHNAQPFVVRSGHSRHIKYWLRPHKRQAHGKERQ